MSSEREMISKYLDIDMNTYDEMIKDYPFLLKKIRVCYKNSDLLKLLKKRYENFNFLYEDEEFYKKYSSCTLPQINSANFSIDDCKSMSYEEYCENMKELNYSKNHITNTAVGGMIYAVINYKIQLCKIVNPEFDKRMEMEQSLKNGNSNSNNVSKL